MADDPGVVVIEIGEGSDVDAELDKDSFDGFERSDFEIECDS